MDGHLSIKNYAIFRPLYYIVIFQYVRKNAISKL